MTNEQNTIDNRLKEIASHLKGMRGDNLINRISLLFAISAACAVGYCSSWSDKPTIVEMYKPVSIQINDETRRQLEKLVENVRPQLQTRDVTGNPQPETFYVIDGKRAYLSVDGKPIEDFLSK